MIEEHAFRCKRCRTAFRADMDDSVELYRRTVHAGVERVAAQIAAQERPLTGVAPERLAPTISTG